MTADSLIDSLTLYSLHLDSWTLALIRVSPPWQLSLTVSATAPASTRSNAAAASLTVWSPSSSCAALPSPHGSFESSPGLFPSQLVF